MMFGSVPFAGTMTERPIGITVGRRRAVPAVPGMQHTRELAGRIVAHDRAHLAAERGERLGLQFGMLYHAAPEGPRVRDDDAHLHRRHYRPRPVRLRSSHDREILRLALPALGALAAEPLYVLVDTAIVGHLGRPQLAALGLAGTVLAGTFTIFNFLAYGTTAVVARASGAGQHERAARLAAQALWLSLGIGLALVAVCEAVAVPLLDGLGAHGSSGDVRADVLPDRGARPAGGARRARRAGLPARRLRTSAARL